MPPVDVDFTALEEETPAEHDGVTVNPDPWAGRRGEPRLFAFFWTMYVFGAAAGSVFWLARSGGWMIGGYGPAARLMLVVVAAGATLLWPMTRLSQSSPGGWAAVGGALGDAIVVILPIQMVVWPTLWLAGWPLDTVIAIAAVFAVWVGLAGGVLAVALGGEAIERTRDPRLASRALWMIALVLLTLAGLATGLIHQSGTPPGWLALLSPLGGIMALAGEGVSGPRAAVTQAQWLTIAGVGLVALAWWMLATGRALLGARGKPRLPPPDHAA